MSSSVRIAPDREFRFCQTDQVRGVALLALQAFPEMALGLDDRVRLYESWIASLGAPIMAVRANSVEVGYSCILPLTENAYGDYRRGAIRDLEFTASDFDASDAAGGSARFICIQAILLKQPVKRELWESFKSAFLCHLTYFSSEPETVSPLLIAEGATPQGVRLLRQWGFARVGTAAGGASLYELDLRGDRIGPRGSRTRELLIETADLRRRSRCRRR